MTKKTRIISAFPASGKSYLADDYTQHSNIIVHDSDSSKYSWILDKEGNSTSERNPEFPTNYISHIKALIGKVDYILVSSHIDVRRALEKADLAWVYVVPDSKLMIEWVGRCYLRGNTKDFIGTMVNNWEDWTASYEDGLSPVGVCKLQQGEYLEDKMHFIETLIYN